MCLVPPARFLAPSYRLLPSSTHLCEQLLSREQVQRHGEAPIATSNMVPLPTMEIFDTAPSLVSRGCSGWSDLGHQRLCLQLALEAGNGDGATETKELVDRRRGHGCGRALTVRDARCGRLSETGAHPSRCERAGLFWWWPTSVPRCGQQRGELGVGRRRRAREQRKVRGRVNLRAWVADASRNGASNLVSVSGGLGAGSRSANPRLRGSARVLALLGAGRGRGASGRQRVPIPRPQTATPRELSTWPKPTGPFRTPARRPQRQRRVLHECRRQILRRLSVL